MAEISGINMLIFPVDIVGRSVVIPVALHDDRFIKEITGINMLTFLVDIISAYTSGIA